MMAVHRNSEWFRSGDLNQQSGIIKNVSFLKQERQTI